jgi:hypothetical protein
MTVCVIIAIILQTLYGEGTLSNAPIEDIQLVQPLYVWTEASHNETIKHRNLDALIPSHLILTVTTLVLNQGRFLCEWIELHKVMGFQLFIIFDDNSTDNTRDVLHSYIASGDVILIHAKKSFRQCKYRKKGRQIHLQDECQYAVFNYAHTQLIGKTKWMGNFDIDEFLWTPYRSHSLTWLLSVKYARYDAINIVASVFGNNNNTEPSYQSVLGTFPRRSDSKKDFTDLNYGGIKFGKKALYRPETTTITHVGIHSIDCNGCRQLTIKPLASDLRMNHYRYKSRKEQHLKSIVNGNPDIELDQAAEKLMNAVEDKGILYLTPRISSCFAAGST